MSTFVSAVDDAHPHPCGHHCGCAVPDDPQCVDCAIRAAPTVAVSAGARQAIWSARWPANHPHVVDGSTLPTALESAPPVPRASKT